MVTDIRCYLANMLRYLANMLRRCTAALDDPEAFRPQIGLSTAALGSTRARSQRPVVPAARFTEQVTEDVMAWVSAMPAFSSSTLTGELLQGVAEIPLSDSQSCLQTFSTAS